MDLESVNDDLINVRQGIKDVFGAQDDEIIELKNPTHDELKATFRKLSLFASKNWQEGEQTTMFFTYFAGHGVMNNFTQAVVNSDHVIKYRFALEKFIRILGSF